MDNGNSKVELGKISIMEVTILDDDGKHILQQVFLGCLNICITESYLIFADPGILSFEKRGMLVKESSGFVRVTVVRRRGASGEVGIKWRTIDRSAISGKDFKGGSGELVFKHYEVSRRIS